jgi:hypothetical protein
MGIWGRAMDEIYRNDPHITHCNTHSDDNQTSIALFTNQDEESVMKDSMSLIRHITKCVTFEPSIKKELYFILSKIIYISNECWWSTEKLLVETCNVYSFKSSKDNSKR